MEALKKRLPPANSLVVFEAVARHTSFTRAARELGVTQAAVSRQVQLLEDHLGVKLFARLHRSVRLTGEGESLHEAVSIGLGHIARAAEELRRVQDMADVTVSCSVTFASYWLMSRIATFRAEFRDVDIRMLASARVRDLAVSGIDLAVRYGRGTWPGVATDYLFGDEVLAVCAPAYAERHGPFDTLQSLADATLLHLAKFDRNWVTWEAWLAAFGMDVPATARSQYFDNYMVLINAAVRGAGIALCGGRLAEDFIERGELVRATERTLESEFSFYLLYPDSRPLSVHAGRFRDWLLEEARGAD